MKHEITRLVEDYECGRLSRRALVGRLAGLMGVLGGAAAVMGRGVPRGRQEGQAGGAAEPTFASTDLNHLALGVTDLARSRDFYVKHLGLTVASEGRSSCFLRCGERDFPALFLAEKAAMDHYCFSIREYEPDAAMRRLEAAGLKAERRGDRVYFDDPDGIEVQVASRTHGV